MYWNYYCFFQTFWEGSIFETRIDEKRQCRNYSIFYFFKYKVIENVTIGAVFSFQFLMTSDIVVK